MSVPQTAAHAQAETQDAAIAYARRGWSVIPLRPGSKRPAVAWERYQQVAAPPERAAAYWREHPEHGIGIVTGAVSGVWVLDIDVHHGGDDSLADLEADHGRLPDTVEAITGRGGRHLYYRHPGGPVPNRAGLRPGIDVRGDGGYVVAPPSIHPDTGRRYEWELSSHPDEVSIADGPGWLLSLVVERKDSAPTPASEWRQIVRDGAGEGERNSTVARLAGHMLRRYVDPFVVIDLLLAWNAVRCRPPLPPDEVERTVDSICAAELRRRGGGRHVG